MAYSDHNNVENYNRLFILGGKGCSEDDFRTAFSQYGTVKDLWIVRNRTTNEEKGEQSTSPKPSIIAHDTGLPLHSIIVSIVYDTIIWSACFSSSTSPLISNQFSLNFVQDISKSCPN